MWHGGGSLSPRLPFAAACLAALLFLALSFHGASGTEASSARPRDWRGKILLSAQLSLAQRRDPGEGLGLGAGSVFLLADPNSQSLAVFAADLPTGPG